MQQIYASILNVDPSTGEIVPEMAESSGFVSPSLYRVVMREGLTFTNGNSLTASDAVHSLERIRRIDSPNGPQILLENFGAINLVDDKTFEIELLIPNDNTVENVLSSMVGLVVDEEVFPSDRIFNNDEILAAKPYSGPYVVTAFEQDSLMALEPNRDYQGVWGQARNSGVIVRAFQDLNNMAAALESRELDLLIGYRSTVLPQLIDLGQEPGYVLIPGPSTEGVYLWLSHRNLPYGSSVVNPDAGKAKLVRQAIAAVIDRSEINAYAYFDTYAEMPSAVPQDVAPLDLIARTTFVGSGDEQAEEIVASLGLDIPVKLELLTSESRWGDLSVRLSTIVKEQLERSGLFEISIVALEWSEFRERRKEGTFELSLQMWGHDFADVDNYLTPLVTTDSWVNNGYSNDVVDSLVMEQASAPNAEARVETLSRLLGILHEDLPFIPLVSGGPFVVAEESLVGVDGFVNSHWKLIFAHLTK